MSRKRRKTATVKQKNDVEAEKAREAKFREAALKSCLLDEVGLPLAARSNMLAKSPHFEMLRHFKRIVEEITVATDRGQTGVMVQGGMSDWPHMQAKLEAYGYECQAADSWFDDCYLVSWEDSRYWSTEIPGKSRKRPLTRRPRGAKVSA